MAKRADRIYESFYSRKEAEKYRDNLKKKGISARVKVSQKYTYPIYNVVGSWGEGKPTRKTSLPTTIRF